MQVYYQAPYKPAQLYVPVPAHYKAHSSDYTYCFLTSAYQRPGYERLSGEVSTCYRVVPAL